MLVILTTYSPSHLCCASCAYWCAELSGLLLVIVRMVVVVMVEIGLTSHQTLVTAPVASTG